MGIPYYLYQEGVAPCSKEPLKVSIDGWVCGEIRKVDGGFQYFQNGGKPWGEVLPTVGEVQAMLRATNA
jgi:hypothetical protein